MSREELTKAAAKYAHGTEKEAEKQLIALAAFLAGALIQREADAKLAEVKAPYPYFNRGGRPMNCGCGKEIARKIRAQGEGNHEK